jgi:hypothetical protein
MGGGGEQDGGKDQGIHLRGHFRDRALAHVPA